MHELHTNPPAESQTIDAEIPTIPCVVSDDGKQLKFWCPYCKKFHWHGNVGGGGHRGAHCWTKIGLAAFRHGYDLVIDPEGHARWMGEHKKRKTKADRRRSLTSTQQIDFAKLMEPVARELLGAPNESLSSKTELRWGTRGSFVVNLAKGVWRDHEANEGGGTLDLIELKTGRKDPFKWLEERGHVNGARKRKPKPGPIVETYDYLNADGIFSFQVTRHDPKDFRQRRRGKDGEWIWDLNGVQPIPYRLPELIEAVSAGHTIHIPEGEQDVNRLWSIGLPATCNSGGAGNWKPELNEHFKGADVVVIADNDPQAKDDNGNLKFYKDGRPVFPGQDHARDVARQLSRAEARRVRLIMLGEVWPECPPKGDVSDFLKDHSREQLDALIEAAPVFKTSDAPAEISLDDFRAYMPTHAYIYVPTREMWTAASVDARLGKVNRIKASTWLDRNKPVEQMTWAPGEPMLIPDRVVAEGGWVDHRGATVFNLYKPPTIARGDAKKVGPWVRHVFKVYRRDAKHIIRWLAHRVQRPQEKVNHGIVLGGAQGIGKDTLIEPVKRAVGPWNVVEVSPQQMLGQFNGFAKAVILRVSEARDLGEQNRFAFYEHMKVYLAAPPDVIRCNEKFLREHSVLNCCGVIVTSNRKDSFCLTADDRRHFFAWSDLSKEDFPEGYWKKIWGWYDSGGYGHVAAYLAQLDLTDFDAKAPPPKTTAFWEVVNLNRTPEDAELADVLDGLHNPKAVTLKMIRNQALNQGTGDFDEWLDDRRNSRQIPHRMAECGYVPVRNDAAKDGFWRINGRRQVVYARADLSVRDRHAAARQL